MKKIISVLLALIVMFSFIACSSDKNVEENRNDDDNPIIEVKNSKSNNQSGGTKVSGSVNVNNIINDRKKSDYNLEGFVNRYNNFTDAYKNASGISMPSITMTDAKSGTFKPNSWSSFDIIMSDSEHISEVIYNAYLESAAQDKNTLELIYCISAIMSSIDRKLTLEQRKNFIGELMDYDIATGNKFEKVINEYKYEYEYMNVLSGVLMFTATRIE